MKAILREDQSGVSEVLGTILILGMTVTLFSVIIVWVSSVPAPVAQTRVDLLPAMTATSTGGGVLITLSHRGGEPLYPVPTVIYVADTPTGSSVQTTDVVTLHLFNPRLANPSGLLDGSDSIWSIGERWEYENFRWNVSDSITVTIVDTSKNTVEWTGNMNPNSGTRPPVFLNVWASGALNSGQPSPVYSKNGFFLYAEVISPTTGGFIRPNSVFANITPLFPSCSAVPMLDNGQSPDIAPGDNIFSAGGSGNSCMNAPNNPDQSWSGQFILINATDNAGNRVQTRFVLNVLPNPTTIQNTQTIPSQLWQYIGFVQIRTGEVWISNLSLPYNTPNTYQPFRVFGSWLKTGVLFHFKMANHGNTTIFMDGWTEAFFQNTQASAGAVMFSVAPCSTLINSGAGGVQPYPGSTTLINDFEYAHPGLPAGCQLTTQPAVFDINPLNQETGGTPYVVLVGSKTAFSSPSAINWLTSTYFISILVSGMSGPVNYTYAMLTGQAGQANPFGCGGLNSAYNPLNHLNDPIPKCRTQWYAQVIPFVGMVVF